MIKKKFKDYFKKKLDKAKKDGLIDKWEIYYNNEEQRVFTIEIQRNDPIKPNYAWFKKKRISEDYLINLRFPFDVCDYIVNEMLEELYS